MHESKYCIFSPIIPKHLNQKSIQTIEKNPTKMADMVGFIVKGRAGDCGTGGMSLHP